MTNFAVTLTEDRRLVILRVLAEAPGYKGNESLLHAMLDEFGHVVSRDQVRTDLSWLAEQGLLTTEVIADIMIVEITSRGTDVAAGRASVPGVKRPRAKR